MRAALFHEFGGPEVLRVEDVPTPEPGPGEVRLAVRAAAFNHLDLWVRRRLPIETTMPHIGGADVAGVVDAVGPGVETSAVGARVAVDPALDYEWYERRPRGEAFDDPPMRLLGEHTNGGFAEYAIVPARNLLQLPDGVSFETAAAAGLVAVTAWRGLMARGGLRAGEDVLVTGASGGVGTMAVQIAALAGARVHAVTSGPDNVARVEALGAHHAYDRTAGDWVRPLKERTGGRGVDVALDSVGAALWESVLRSLAVRGRLVSYGATTGANGTTEIRHLFWKQLSILGTTMGTPAEYRTVMQLVFQGHLKPVVHQVLSLDEVRAGHELLEAGDVFGKLVVKP